MNSAEQLVSLIRETTRGELAKEDSTSICQIASVNNDKTVDIYILPDTRTLIRGIFNNSNSELLAGDTAELYKIKNQISNSFIMAKCGGPREKIVQSATSSIGGGSIVISGGGGTTVIVDDKTYIKEFTKDDWVSISNNGQPPFRLSIPNHNLVNPYVVAVLVKGSDSSGEFFTPIVTQSKLWASGTMNIYIQTEIPDDYSGKVYLKGE